MVPKSLTLYTHDEVHEQTQSNERRRTLQHSWRGMLVAWPQLWAPCSTRSTNMSVLPPFFGAADECQDFVFLPGLKNLLPVSVTSLSQMPLFLSAGHKNWAGLSVKIIDSAEIEDTVLP
jgi:hypothetical protein